MQTEAQIGQEVPNVAPTLKEVIKVAHDCSSLSAALVGLPVYPRNSGEAEGGRCLITELSGSTTQNTCSAPAPSPQVPNVRAVVRMSTPPGVLVDMACKQRIVPPRPPLAPGVFPPKSRLSLGSMTRARQAREAAQGCVWLERQVGGFALC